MRSMLSSSPGNYAVDIGVSVDVQYLETLTGDKYIENTSIYTRIPNFDVILENETKSKKKTKNSNNSELPCVVRFNIFNERWR